MKITEFRKLIREEVRKVLKSGKLNEAVGQARDNAENVNGLTSLLRNASIAKQVKAELVDLLSEPEYKKFAQSFDNMISNYLDEPIRGL